SRSASEGGSRRSTTSPSGSPVEVVAVRATSVTYRLSSPTKHGASLVAAPDNRSSKPVAKGSRVPAWPVRARVRRRWSATSANEEGPAGLSTRKIPTGLSARGGIRRARGAVARSRGHEGPVDEVDDLADLATTREPGCLPVTAAADLARDRGDIHLVVARAKRDPSRRSLVARRLADEGDHLRALDLPQVVDDPFRV